MSENHQLASQVPKLLSEEVQPIIAVLTNVVKCCFDVFGFDLGVSRVFLPNYEAEISISPNNCY
jgi:hypothetical protein